MKNIVVTDGLKSRIETRMQEDNHFTTFDRLRLFLMKSVLFSLNSIYYKPTILKLILGVFECEFSPRIE